MASLTIIWLGLMATLVMMAKPNAAGPVEAPQKCAKANSEWKVEKKPWDVHADPLTANYVQGSGPIILKYNGALPKNHKLIVNQAGGADKVTVYYSIKGNVKFIPLALPGETKAHKFELSKGILLPRKANIDRLKITVFGSSRELPSFSYSLYTCPDPPKPKVHVPSKAPELAKPAKPLQPPKPPKESATKQTITTKGDSDGTSKNNADGSPNLKRNTTSPAPTRDRCPECFMMGAGKLYGDFLDKLASLEGNK